MDVGLLVWVCEKMLGEIEHINTILKISQVTRVMCLRSIDHTLLR